MSVGIITKSHCPICKNTAYIDYAVKFPTFSCNTEYTEPLYARVWSKVALNFFVRLKFVKWQGFLGISFIGSAV